MRSTADNREFERWLLEKQRKERAKLRDEGLELAARHLETLRDRAVPGWIADEIRSLKGHG
jgi:hypothetical protein